MISKHVFMTPYILLLVVICCGCAAGPSALPNQQPERTSVAVFDFEDLSPQNAVHTDLSPLLTAKAIETIEETDRYDVVERQRLAMVLEELNIGTSDVADHQTQLRLGEITGARLMVFGSYQVVAEKLRLDIRLVEVESGKVLNAVSQVAEEQSIANWMEASARSTAALFQP